MTTRKYFKIGDSFTLPIQFYDAKTNLSMSITDEMLISSVIVNRSGAVIAVPIITKLAEAGMVLLEVAAIVTAQWQEGFAQLDIKLQINDQVRHSQNIQFYIERSITV